MCEEAAIKAIEKINVQGSKNKFVFVGDPLLTFELVRSAEEVLILTTFCTSNIYEN